KRRSVRLKFVGRIGPGSSHRLVKEILVIRVRRGRAVQIRFMPFIPATPARDGRAPLTGHFRKDIEPGAYIFPSFRTVRCGRQERVWMGFGGALIEGVKSVEARAEDGGVAANLVERNEAVEPVERSILDTLGSNRPG